MKSNCPFPFRSSMTKLLSDCGKRKIIHEKSMKWNCKLFGKVVLGLAVTVATPHVQKLKSLQVLGNDHSRYPPDSWVASLAIDSWVGHCLLHKLVGYKFYVYWIPLRWFTHKDTTMRARTHDTQTSHPTRNQTYQNIFLLPRHEEEICSF